MQKVIHHYNCLQVYFNGDEVLFNGDVFTCTPMQGIGITNISPYDSKNWTKKHKTTEEKLVEINERMVKRESDTSLLRNLLDIKEMDDTFMDSCKREILTRQLN